MKPNPECVSIIAPVWLRDYIGKVAFLHEERLYRFTE